MQSSEIYAGIYVGCSNTMDILWWSIPARWTIRPFNRVISWSIFRFLEFDIGVCSNTPNVPWRSSLFSGYHSNLQSSDVSLDSSLVTLNERLYFLQVFKHSPNMPGFLFSQVFDGNADRHTVVYHKFTRHFSAMYVRVHPRTWYSWVSMRVELFGCPIGKSNRQRLMSFGMSSCGSLSGCLAVGK